MKPTRKLLSDGSLIASHQTAHDAHEQLLLAYHETDIGIANHRISQAIDLLGSLATHMGYALIEPACPTTYTEHDARDDDQERAQAAGAM